LSAELTCLWHPPKMTALED